MHFSLRTKIKELLWQLFRQPVLFSPAFWLRIESTIRRIASALNVKLVSHFQDFTVYKVSYIFQFRIWLQLYKDICVWLADLILRPPLGIHLSYVWVQIFVLVNQSQITKKTEMQSILYPSICIWVLYLCILPTSSARRRGSKEAGPRGCRVTEGVGWRWMSSDRGEKRRGGEKELWHQINSVWRGGGGGGGKPMLSFST